MSIIASALALRGLVGPGALLSRQSGPIDVNSLPADCQPPCIGVNTLAAVRFLCLHPSLSTPPNVIPFPCVSFHTRPHLFDL